MNQQEKNEIRERYDSAKRSRTWKALDEADLSLGDIPALLDALDEAINERDYALHKACVASNDAMYWMKRAEALERALRKHGTCASCIHTEKGIKDAPCNECVGKSMHWEFDAARFSGGE